MIRRSARRRGAGCASIMLLALAAPAAGGQVRQPDLAQVVQEATAVLLATVTRQRERRERCVVHHTLDLEAGPLVSGTAPGTRWLALAWMTLTGAKGCPRISYTTPPHPGPVGKGSVIIVTVKDPGGRAAVTVTAGYARERLTEIQAVLRGASGAPPAVLVFPRQVKTRSAPRGAPVAAPLPRGVSFALEGAPVVSLDQIALRGVLTNATATALEVVLLPVGGVAPFTAVLAPSPRLTPKPTAAPPRPPAPPLPLVVTVPARGRVAFDAVVSLNDYLYGGAPDVALRWTFHYWSGPRPTGTVPVKLPARRRAGP